MQRLSVISVTYCLCGMMDVLAGNTRSGLFHAANDRLADWRMCVPYHLDFYGLSRAAYAVHPVCVYPISWILTILAHFVCYLIDTEKVFRPQEI